MIAALWRLSSKIRWDPNALVPKLEMRHPLPTRPNITIFHWPSLATTPTVVLPASTGPTTLGGAHCAVAVDGLTGRAQVILKRHHVPASAFALVAVAEQGTPRRATGRQAPGIHARPFVRALRTTQQDVMSVWAESLAQDGGTLFGTNAKKDLGFGGLRRAWNQVLAVVRPEYRRTHYASLSKLTPSHAHL